MQTKSAFLPQSFPSATFPSATLPSALSSPASYLVQQVAAAAPPALPFGVHNHFRFTSVHYVESTKKSWQGSNPPSPFLTMLRFWERLLSQPLPYEEWMNIYALLMIMVIMLWKMLFWQDFTCHVAICITKDQMVWISIILYLQKKLFPAKKFTKSTIVGELFLKAVLLL